MLAVLLVIFFEGQRLSLNLKITSLAGIENQQPLGILSLPLQHRVHAAVPGFYIVSGEVN